MTVSEELRHPNTEQVKTSTRKVQKMSELYMNIQTDLVSKGSTGRSCAVCGGTAKPNNSVFLPTAEVMICKACAHDLAESLTPKAKTIPVSTVNKPVRKSTVTKPYAYDEKRMAEDIKAEVYIQLLKLGLSQ
jgi:ribosome-binding protein aMBF1 (putative translation factor)